jgi:hypothetical protein
MFLKSRLFFVTVFSLLFLNICADTVDDGKCISLIFNGSQSFDMTTKEIQKGEYELKTTANDPRVICRPIKQKYDPDSTFVLSFDYKSKTGIDQLKIYYTTPNEDPIEKRTVVFGQLKKSKQWTSFNGSFKVHDKNKTWDYFQVFRFDFGDTAGRDIILRNVCLREVKNEAEANKFAEELKIIKDKEEKARPRMSYIDNGKIRLGVNLALGGAITYLADSKTKKNMVNNFDWGRQIQMSFFAFPEGYSENGVKPLEHWKHIGWNPIQAGDYAHNPSKTVDYRNDGKSIYVKCIPMQWPLDNVPGNCFYECWITLDGNTAHVKSRITNNRQDTKQYRGKHQELPAVYVNGPWYKVYTYLGDKPFTGDKVNLINKPMKGFPWDYWLASENWAAMVDDSNWGLGIWKPDDYFFIGNYNYGGKAGEGSKFDNQTSYVAPLHTEIIDHNIVYTYNYVLILGDLEKDIRKYVYEHSDKNRLPDYVFNDDRQSWSYENTTDTGFPIKGELNVSLNAKKPRLIGPLTFWKADKVSKIYINAATNAKGSPGRFYFRPFGYGVINNANEFPKDNYVEFDLISDGKYHTYEIDLTKSSKYKGSFIQMGLQPVTSGRDGEWIKVKSISAKLIDN